MITAQQVAETPSFLVTAMTEALELVAAGHDLTYGQAFAEFEKGRGVIYQEVSKVVALAAEQLANDINQARNEVRNAIPVRQCG
jgi:hypothetical protein